jgi:hypothetical protein
MHDRRLTPTATATKAGVLVPLDHVSADAAGTISATPKTTPPSSDTGSNNQPERRVIAGEEPRTCDLWAIGKEVAKIDLPQTFASLRGASPPTFPAGHLEAMSADILLTTRRMGQNANRGRDPRVTGSSL